LEKSIENVRYYGQYENSGIVHQQAIELIGLDTEAYDNGQCFMLATSDNDIFHYEDFPRCLFTRKYIGKKFAVWNLKYDEGALLQFLSEGLLHELWKTGIVENDGWKIRSIPSKMLSFSWKKHAITIYDMYQFYAMSLDSASQKYLGDRKLEMETKSFTRSYVKNNWELLAKYCIKDAVLVEKLSKRMIGVFKKFGITPQKLYSTAYVSYQYFKSHCHYPTVKRFWDENKSLLGAAMQAYRGGKFEVTRKGVDNYYEYDIISAYPKEIAGLVDTTYARIVYSKKFRREAIYGFCKIETEIPVDTFSPIALKVGALSIYPIGKISTWVTKAEIEYLQRMGVDYKIHEGIWIHIDNKKYPYKKEIERLVQLKQTYKGEETALEYHTVKILLNSLYGKMVQLIKCGEYWKASACWHPIYAAVITANVRIRVTELQQKYNSIVAVHTDSVISTKPLDIPPSKTLGDFTPECEGTGVILGSGIYQIGTKSRFRGFISKLPLMELIDSPNKTVEIEDVHATTWREVAFHSWDTDRINRFEPCMKKMRVDFDRKRIWLNDYTNFRQVLKRQVSSVPIDSSILSFLF
jgi:hypothetical protein